MKVLMTLKKDNEINESIKEGDIFVYDSSKNSKNVYSRALVESDYSSLIGFLEEHDIDTIVTPTIAPWSFSALKARGVVLYKASSLNIDDSIEMLKNNKLDLFVTEMAGSGCSSSCSSCEGGCK